MAEDHSGHDHAVVRHPMHSHGPADYGRAFAIGIALNLAYLVGEATAGLVSHSLALLADAGHNLSDVLGLALAWGAEVLSRRSPSGRFTYGLKSTSILAALANASILLVVTGGITWEAVLRCISPVAVASSVIVWVAVVGIAVHGGTAALFAAGRGSDLNIKGAFLHMAADALVGAGVVIAGIAIGLTGWLRLDPAISLIVSLVIVLGTWGLLKNAVGLALNAVPEGVDAAAVRAHLAALPGVAGLHDLHVWGMSTTETALTCHLVMPGGHPGDDALNAMTQDLHRHFGIVHATIQIELGDGGEVCALTPEHLV
jgi:cobalt-zinc-cadmium efflux system protein